MCLQCAERGENWREVGKFVGRCGERGGESCRKMRRVVVGRCGERGGEICRKMRRVFVGRCGERVGESCRKVFEERLAIVRY